jgi:hypothetical protein
MKLLDWFSQIEVKWYCKWKESETRASEIMVQIQLEDNVAAALADRARARGLSLEEYLADVAIGRETLSHPRVSGDEAVRLIEAEAGPGNPSYKGTYSREDIYFDHG